MIILPRLIEAPLQRPPGDSRTGRGWRRRVGGSGNVRRRGAQRAAASEGRQTPDSQLPTASTQGQPERLSAGLPPKTCNATRTPGDKQSHGISFEFNNFLTTQPPPNLITIIGPASVRGLWRQRQNGRGKNAASVQGLERSEETTESDLSETAGTLPDARPHLKLYTGRKSRRRGSISDLLIPPGGLARNVEND